jgi:hypothetical protein
LRSGRHAGQPQGLERSHSAGAQAHSKEWVDKTWVDAHIKRIRLQNSIKPLGWMAAGRTVTIIPFEADS